MNFEELVNMYGGEYEEIDTGIGKFVLIFDKDKKNFYLPTPAIPNVPFESFIAWARYEDVIGKQIIKDMFPVNTLLVEIDGVERQLWIFKVELKPDNPYMKA